MSVTKGKCLMSYELSVPLFDIRINAQAEELLEYQEYKKCKECVK